MGAVIVLSLDLAIRTYRDFLKITFLDFGDPNWIAYFLQDTFSFIVFSHNLNY